MEVYGILRSGLAVWKEAYFKLTAQAHFRSHSPLRGVDKQYSSFFGRAGRQSGIHITTSPAWAWLLAVSRTNNMVDT